MDLFQHQWTLTQLLPLNWMENFESAGDDESFDLMMKITISSYISIYKYISCIRPLLSAMVECKIHVTITLPGDVFCHVYNLIFHLFIYLAPYFAII